MRKIFAAGFFLKAIFFLAFWILRLYEEWLFARMREDKSSWDFDLEIDFSWALYAAAVLVTVCFLFTTVTAFLYLYRPQKNITRTLGGSGWPAAFFCADLLLAAVFCFFLYTMMPDAFQQRNDAMTQALNLLFDSSPDNRLRTLQKIDAINFAVGLLGLLLTLISFQRFRASNPGVQNSESI